MYLLNDEIKWWLCQGGHSGNFQTEFTCNSLLTTFCQTGYVL